MAYNKKTWLARLGQGLNKFILNGGSKVTLESSPDTVTQQGTPLSAENMNDLEDRIDSEFTNVNSAINAIKTSVRVGITINDSDFTLTRNDSRYYPTLRLLVIDVQFNSSNISVSRKSSAFTIILPTGVSTLSGTRILSSVANEQVDSYLNANLGAYATSEGNVTIDKPSYVTRYAQPRFNAVWYV